MDFQQVISGCFQVISAGVGSFSSCPVLVAHHLSASGFG
jgi:hypothetical protein